MAVALPYPASASSAFRLKGIELSLIFCVTVTLLTNRPAILAIATVGAEPARGHTKAQDQVKSSTLAPSKTLMSRHDRGIHARHPEHLLPDLQENYHSNVL